MNPDLTFLSANALTHTAATVVLQYKYTPNSFSLRETHAGKTPRHTAQIQTGLTGTHGFNSRLSCHASPTTTKTLLGGRKSRLSIDQHLGRPALAQKRAATRTTSDPAVQRLRKGEFFFRMHATPASE